MLLDQQKTKRMVRIVAIVCAVAFVGVLPVVLGLVVFGDGGGSASGQLIEEAESRVRAEPNSVAALVDLAAQYRAADRPQDALETLQKATAAGPSNSEDLQLLVGALSGQIGPQLQVLQTYTRENPRDAAAWFTYGSTAEGAGQQLTARLAYQKAAQFAPKGSTLRENAQTALNRLRDAPVTPPTPVPTTPAEPVTP